MWGKIQLKPVHSWEPCGKDHSLWHRTAMQPKAPQGGCLVEGQPQAGLQWICWGSTWTNPKELLLWGIFRWEEGAATGCSWCCGFAGLHLQNSHNDLLPASRPSRSSSTPGPAPAKSELPKTTNQLRELPAAFPSWDGQQMGAGFLRGTCREARGKTKNYTVTLTSA